MTALRLARPLILNLPAPLRQPIVAALVQRGFVRRDILWYSQLGCPKHVLSGPFAGLRYILQAAGSALLPKILGTYEIEIQPWLRRLAATQHDLMVDIGAAEGYYACGFARVSPECRVLAFDTDPAARSALRHLADKNNLSPQIRIESECTQANLQQELQRANCPLVLSDCEGYELDLLDLEAVPALRHATMLVETHDSKRTGCADTIRQRFGNTHQVESIDTMLRDAQHWPREASAPVPDHLKCQMMDENRHAPQEWLLLTPNQVAK